MALTTVDIGGLVAENAEKYLGVRSAHHSRFHTGIYFPETGNLPRSPETEEFLRKIANLKWVNNYLVYLQQVHSPYSPETGLDCSGLVNLAATEAFELVGIKAEVPRHVKEFYTWPLTVFVALDKVRRGDFLFSHRNPKRQPPDHTGIYLGNRQVVHSHGIEGGKVEKVSLDEFVSKVEPFEGRLVAAKRLYVR